MATEKFFVFNEAGTLKRLKGRIVRFLDNEDPSGSDKSAIRTSLEVSPDAEGLVQADVGTAPNEIPVNGMLGELAYQSADSVAMGTAEVETLEVTDNLEVIPPGSDINPGIVSKVGAFLSSNSEVGLGFSGFPSGDGANKSAIIHERKDTYGRGDLHICSNYDADATNANKADAVITVDGSTGSVGIGGSPTRKLEVKKTGFLGSSTLGSPTDSTVSIDVRGNASTDIVQGEVLGAYTLDAYDSSGATGGGVTQNSGMHFVAGNHFGASASSVDLVFATGANGSTAERWRINSSGNLVANSTGIDFGSGGASSVLDDYERGTATPTDASGAGLTLAGVGMNYVKIGSQVTAWVKVTYPTTSDTSTARIGNLPFAIGSSDIDRIGGFVASQDTGLSVSVLGTTGTGQVTFRKTSGAPYANSELSGKFIWFCFIYDVS